MHALTTKANFYANCNLKMYVSAIYSDKRIFGNRTGMATGRLKRWEGPLSMHTRGNAMGFWIHCVF